MKGIIVLFLLMFGTLAGAVYFYETKIASPKAAAQTKSKKNKLTPPLAIAKTTITPVAPIVPVKHSRVVELSNLDRSERQTPKERLIKNKAIQASISSTIKKSIRLEIQKAVVSEMGRKR